LNKSKDSSPTGQDSIPPSSTVSATTSTVIEAEQQSTIPEVFSLPHSRLNESEKSEKELDETGVF